VDLSFYASRKAGDVWDKEKTQAAVEHLVQEMAKPRHPRIVSEVSYAAKTILRAVLEVGGECASIAGAISSAG
jgi:hypothetical protein